MRRNKTKRLLSKLLTLSMVLTLMMTCLVVLPTEVLAATNVAYLDADGNTKTASSATEITTSTNELTTGWYVVNGPVTRTETITVTGDVHLILADGCNLTVTGDERKAGINVNDANRLTIYDQAGHTGVLNVTGDQGGAGIGSGYMESGGFITINGGIINATGGDGDYDNNSGAGIGDGGYSDGIKIIINGGEIIATGGGGDEYGSWTGAGIGGHESDITITGGKITATGGKNKDGLDVMGGAGIGGSGKADVNTIIISGGTVTATGGPNAAGVGGGEMGVGGVITISGGVVNATGSDYPGIGGFTMGGAGIGSGAGAHDNDGEYETTITISGTSTVTATGAFGSAGIGTGTGAESNHSATITIDGGTVTGIGGVGGAGIGGGLMLDGGTITIKSGTVTATGGEGISGEELTIFGGTGIGGGSGASMGDFTIPSGSGGTANISGGLVFAKGDDSAKDIGGALDSSGGSLAISGTAAVFLRNDSSVEPVDTTTHTHKNIGNHVANTTAFGIPVSWDGNFGAWLVLSTISFDSAGGSAVAGITQGQGTVITPPADPTREGYTFNGWMPAIPTAMPLNGLVVKAQWTKNATNPTGTAATNPTGTAATNPTGTVASDSREDIPKTGENAPYLHVGITLILLAAGLSILWKWNKVKQ